MAIAIADTQPDDTGAPFDKLKSFQFGAIPFPYINYTITGGLRKHVHEFPHFAGGLVEKLGRSLYEVTVNADFNSGLDHPKYFKLLNDLTFGLHNQFELGMTDDLHVPHIGTFRAIATSWIETVHHTNRSSVLVEMKFIEDLTTAYLVFEPDKARAKDGIKEAAKDFETALEGTPMSSMDIFSQINNIALEVFAVADQASLYGSLVASKIESFTQLMRHADATVKELGKPQYWEAREALDRMRLAALDLADDLQRQDRLLREFVSPFTMSIGQIADAIYGDYTRGGELMQLNILPNPLQVAPGTIIRYYQAA